MSEGRLAQSPTGGSNRGPMESEERNLHFNVASLCVSSDLYSVLSVQRCGKIN